MADEVKKYNRFQVALDIQNACNPSGVAIELVKIIKDAMDDPACKGTMAVRGDPAVAMVVQKLHDLTFYPSSISNFSRVYRDCEKLAAATANGETIPPEKRTWMPHEEK